MTHQETSYRETAFNFATSLINGQSEDAYFLLGFSIRDQWNPSLIQETYQKMVEYFHEPANSISVDIVDTELPNIPPNSGWVYVSIFGEGNCEAVTLIISQEDDKFLIQSIEWGRP
jgi:hypothetical protein